MYLEEILFLATLDNFSLLPLCYFTLEMLSYNKKIEIIKISRMVNVR